MERKSHYIPSDGRRPLSYMLVCFSSQDLHAFLQTLFEPWGFGSEYKATKREMRNKVRRLNLPIFEGNRVHFKVRLRRSCSLARHIFRVAPTFCL